MTSFGSTCSILDFVNFSRYFLKIFLTSDRELNLLYIKELTKSFSDFDSTVYGEDVSITTDNSF